MSGSGGRACRTLPWLLAAAGFALTLAAFWPGYLSWDSAYQWWQARGGTIDTTHPPVMVRVWQLARALLPDPGGMLALQAALWWSALALFANAVGGSALRRGGTVVLLGMWPPLLALLPHLWKDVWMTALLAWAVAALAADLRAPRTGWRLLALAALALACAFRFNALPAALPLLAWIAWRQVGAAAPLSRRRPLLATVLGSLVLVVVVHLAATLLNRAPGSREVAVWPSVALWDLAAVSIAERQLLFPPEWVDPALTVADLRGDFQPYVNVPSFEGGQLRLNYYYDYTPAQYARLRAAWLALPLRHPRAYFGHRLRLSAYLLGLRPSAHPDGLVISPGVVAFGDNPPLAANTGAVNRVLQPALSRLVDTPLFAAWPALLLALAIVVAWLRTRGGAGPRRLAAAVAASSLLLAAPLLLLAPSSDFRYLLWCVAAALLAALLWWAPAAEPAAASAMLAPSRRPGPLPPDRS